ncbi:hypothetical protein CAP35_07900 [Chitinophagaceae bacterium IBVUCB1]|nr:hypothetical protein CAP35_07900 [Chitinophagaceae bacterium IBVUCB1]
MLLIRTSILAFVCVCLFSISKAQTYKLSKVSHYRYTYNSATAVYKMALIDSAIYYYNDNRGGYFTNDWLYNTFNLKTYTPEFLEMNLNCKHDSAIWYNYHPIIGTIYKHNKFIQQFDLLNNVIKYTTLQLSNTGAPVYTTIDSYLYSGNILLRGISEYYYYNGLGQLDSAKYKYGLPSKYHYNSSGNIDSIVSYSGTKVAYVKRYVYNTNKQVVEIWDYDFSSFNIVIYKTKYAYNTLGQPIEIIKEKYDPSSTTFLNYDKKLLTYNSANNLQHEIIIEWKNNAWDTFRRMTYQYNNLNLITIAESDFWDKAKQNWVYRIDTFEKGNTHRYNFYYSAHFPSSINKQVENINLTLYPNPAADFISVRAQLSGKHPYTIQVTDMNGRVLKTWDEPAARTIQKQIPVAELPAGTYLLRLRTADAETTETFIISK